MPLKGLFIETDPFPHPEKHVFLLQISNFICKRFFTSRHPQVYTQKLFHENVIYPNSHFILKESS